jgi:hypothetical protein
MHVQASRRAPVRRGRPARGAQRLTAVKCHGRWNEQPLLARAGRAGGHRPGDEVVHNTRRVFVRPAYFQEPVSIRTDYLQRRPASSGISLVCSLCKAHKGSRVARDPRRDLAYELYGSAPGFYDSPIKNRGLMRILAGQMSESRCLVPWRRKTQGRMPAPWSSFG